MAGKQPGIMLYFDVRPSLKRLSTEEKGTLFEAILDYGEHGVVPELDGVLGIAWDFIQPKLDRDRQRYVEISQKRAEAASARWEKEKQMQMDADAFFAMQTMPTTTSTPTSTTAPTTSSYSKTTSALLSPTTPTGGPRPASEIGRCRGHPEVEHKQLWPL